MDMAVNKLRAPISREFPVEARTAVVAHVGTDCATELLSGSPYRRVSTPLRHQRHCDNALRNVIVHIMHAC